MPNLLWESADASTLVEVASDLCGGISGVCLVIPVYRLVKLRAALRKVRQQLLAAGVTEDNLAIQLEKRIRQALGDSNPWDDRLLHVGTWLLLAAFVLKICLHINLKGCVVIAWLGFACAG